MQTRVRNVPAAASSIPLAAVVVTDAEAAAPKGRDLRSSAASLEQRGIKAG
jgi:hypothetical protein